MKYIKYTIVTLLCIIIVSCTTTQKISIQGKPGSEIYSPDMSRLGIINETGSVEIKLPSDGYYAYLLSHDKESEQLIPFALDYKNNNYYGTYFVKHFGNSLGIAGTTSLLMSTIILLAGGEDIAIPFLFAGIGLDAVGLPLMLAGSRTEQTQYEHKFKYSSRQKTNQDIEFVPVKDNGLKKETTESAVIASKVIDKKVTSNGEKYSVSKRKIKKTFSIHGSHKGTGVLCLDNDIVENYGNIVIEIEKISNEKVFVSVYENGEQYFNAKSIYKIENNKDTCILSMEDIPSATIIIDKNGNMEYIHPKVNIEDGIYTLKISVNK